MRGPSRRLQTSRADAKRDALSSAQGARLVSSYPIRSPTRPRVGVLTRRGACITRTGMPNPAYGA